MTREEAINILANLKRYMSGDGGVVVVYRNANEALDMAIEALKAQEWIPCSERLPLVGDTYIVTVEDKDGRHVDAADSHGDYIDGWNTFNDWYEGQEVHVIAWMPLPEPYCGYGRETWDYCPYCGSRNRKE